MVHSGNIQGVAGKIFIFGLRDVRGSHGVACLIFSRGLQAVGTTRHHLAILTSFVRVDVLFVEDCFAF
jgi:hypothetical protein